MVGNPELRRSVDRLRDPVAGYHLVKLLVRGHLGHSVLPSEFGNGSRQGRKGNLAPTTRRSPPAADDEGENEEAFPASPRAWAFVVACPMPGERAAWEHVRGHCTANPRLAAQPLIGCRPRRRRAFRELRRSQPLATGRRGRAAGIKCLDDNRREIV